MGYGSGKARAQRKKRRETLQKYQTVCCWCGKPMQRTNKRAWDFETIEHLQPKSKGGNGQINNLSLAHLRCNMRRSSAEQTPAFHHLQR